MTRKVFLKRAASLALAAALLVTAGAPHRHGASFSELWRDVEGLASSEYHQVSCADPTARHWHADRNVEAETCLACLRQHLQGILLSAGAPAPAVPQAEAHRPFRRIAGTSIQADHSSRAPPFDLSANS